MPLISAECRNKVRVSGAACAGARVAGARSTEAWGQSWAGIVSLIIEAAQSESDNTPAGKVCAGLLAPLPLPLVTYSP